MEKLASLRDAVQGGPARRVIEALSWTAGSYAEAIDTLKSVTIGLI